VIAMAIRTSRPTSSRYLAAAGKLGRIVQTLGPDSFEAAQARVERDVIGIEDKLAALIESAPAPTLEQLERLRRLLPAVAA
jgi:hypothetical protein